MIKTGDIQWLAGLLEGEGCFSLYQGKYARIVLSMTDLDIVIKAKQILGSSRDIQRLTNKDRNNKEIYRIVSTGNLAIQWLMTLYPLMGIRRKAKIQELLSAWKSSTIRRDGFCNKGHQISGSNAFLKGNKIYCLACYQIKYPNSFCRIRRVS